MLFVTVIFIIVFVICRNNHRVKLSANFARAFSISPLHHTFRSCKILSKITINYRYSISVPLAFRNSMNWIKSTRIVWDSLAPSQLVCNIQIFWTRAGIAAFFRSGSSPMWTKNCCFETHTFFKSTTCYLTSMMAVRQFKRSIKSCFKEDLIKEWASFL